MSPDTQTSAPPLALTVTHSNPPRNKLINFTGPLALWLRNKRGEERSGPPGNNAAFHCKKTCREVWLRGRRAPASSLAAHMVIKSHVCGCRRSLRSSCKSCDVGTTRLVPLMEGSVQLSFDTTGRRPLKNSQNVFKFAAGNNINVVGLERGNQSPQW